MYRGVTTIGLENFTGLYSNLESFNNGFSRGLQHLFFKDYQYDLIRKGVSICRISDEIFYSNIRYDLLHAPREIKIIEEGWENVYKVYSKYEKSKNIKRSSYCYVIDKAIIFEEEIINENNQSVQVDLYGYVFFNNEKGREAKFDKDNDCIIWQTSFKNKNLIIALKEKSQFYNLSSEHVNFDFYGLQKIIEEKWDKKEVLSSTYGLSASLGRRYNIRSGEKLNFQWFIIPCDNITEGLGVLQQLRSTNVEQYAINLYKKFFDTGEQIDFKDPIHREIYERNLLAIKSVNLGGFIPADITGHYFSEKGPCFYIRDALMVAKAFIFAGYFTEAKKILNFINTLETKTRGEFYQRYDCFALPSEGANNYVEHQLDSIGYYLSVMKYYYDATGELLVSKDFIEDIIDCCERYISELQLIGPEGGVNEGVYGPAYITSTNMFILGGLLNIKKLIKKNLNSNGAILQRIENLITKLSTGLNNMWDEINKYYYYGFSCASNSIIKRYDTPQYFAPLFGYYDPRMIENNNFLLKNASFHGDGIGYSQQSYHHGAWIFNTAACAQFNYFIKNYTEYYKKIDWLINHTNNFGLMPEAIDTQDENICYINPLTWACAELVSALAYPRFLERYFEEEWFEQKSSKRRYLKC